MKKSENFRTEVANMDKDKAEAEFGDVMFSLINAASLRSILITLNLPIKVYPSLQLFGGTYYQGRKSLKDMSLEEMDAWRNEAKKKDCKTYE